MTNDPAGQVANDPAGQMAGSTELGTEHSWVLLEHRPAPGAVAEPTAVFADPRFAGHVAFLRRMTAEHWLVAAGPVPAEPGTGMTLLRLPGAHRLDSVLELARTQDASVVEGLFTVTATGWDVMMSVLDRPPG